MIGLARYRKFVVALLTFVHTVAVIQAVHSPAVRWWVPLGTAVGAVLTYVVPNG
jgi:hypothetical protein